jgi:hypothetical protein
MAKDIVQEAVEQAEAMKEAAYENAKSVLVDAMSTNLKAAVSEAIGEKIEETGNPKGADLNVQYDPSGIEKLDGDDLTDEGDGPAIVEAGLDEDDEYGGNKGDESRSHRDYEGDDEDENEGDEYGGDKGDESRSRRDYEAALEGEDDEEADIDIDVDVDDDEDDDLDEVLEIIEDEDEDDVDVDIDVDDDEDVDEGEYGGDKGDESRSRRDYESAVREVKSLKRENRRYEKALTFLKKRIDEVNLFNARLAAASDLMRKVSLTKGEKERVVEHFDKARTVGEVKRTHRALTEGYTAANRSVKKQRVARPNVQSVISEEQKQSQDGQYDRMAELAGL